MFSEHVQSRADRRQSTHATVLSAAARLFREHGFEATTVRQVAAEAGVSTGTVMAVGDKNALLVAAFDSWIADLQQSGSPGEPEVSNGSAGERIAEIVRPFVELFASDQDLARAYAAVLVSGTHDAEIFTRLAEGLLLEFEQVLGDAGIPAARRRSAARAVYFAYFGILFNWAGTASDVPSALGELRSVVDVVTGTGGD